MVKPGGVAVSGVLVDNWWDMWEDHSVDGAGAVVALLSFGEDAGGGDVAAHFVHFADVGLGCADLLAVLGQLARDHCLHFAQLLQVGLAHSDALLDGIVVLAVLQVLLVRLLEILSTFLNAFLILLDPASGLAAALEQLGDLMNLLDLCLEALSGRGVTLNSSALMTFS